MNPAEPQRIGEALISLRRRATSLEAVLGHEASQRIAVARRAAELGGLIDQRLKVLEHRGPLSPQVFFAPTRRAQERPAAWTAGLAITLVVILAAFWASRSTPIAGPAISHVSPVAPTTASPAVAPSTAPPAGRRHAAGDDDASPPTAGNSPVFELYSPKAPATPPH